MIPLRRWKLSEELLNGGKIETSIGILLQLLTFRPHIICDGRILASLWDISHTNFPGRVGRPNEKLIENYFVNLAVRG
jgi:hypothetical protein